MKVSLLSLALGLGIITLNSCKKEYTCLCSTSVNGLQYSSYNQTLRSTKRKAKEWCENLDSNYNGNYYYGLVGYNYSIQCELY